MGTLCSCLWKFYVALWEKYAAIEAYIFNFITGNNGAMGTLCSFMGGLRRYRNFRDR